MTTRVVVLRGTAANPWDLRPWESLGPQFEATVLVPPNNQYDVSGLELAAARVETVGGRLPGGRVGGLLTRALGERYLGLEDAPARRGHRARRRAGLLVHARRRRGCSAKLGFRLVADGVGDAAVRRAPTATCARAAYRAAVLAATDLFLPTTERARDALLLEGAAPSAIEVAPPGDRRRALRRSADAPARLRRPPSRSLDRAAGVGEGPPGRAARARAAAPARAAPTCALLIVGVGPEERRLRAVRRGPRGRRPRRVPRLRSRTTRCPASTRAASCLVLASPADAVLGGAVRDGARGGDGARTCRSSPPTAARSRRCVGGVRHALRRRRLASGWRRRWPTGRSPRRRARVARPSRTGWSATRRRQPPIGCGPPTSGCDERGDERATSSIVTWNGRERAGCAACEHLRHARRADAASSWSTTPLTDGTAAMVRERFPGVEVIELAENVGFGRGGQRRRLRPATARRSCSSTTTSRSSSAASRRARGAARAGPAVGMVAGPHARSPAPSSSTASASSST